MPNVPKEPPEAIMAQSTQPMAFSLPLRESPCDPTIRSTEDLDGDGVEEGVDIEPGTVIGGVYRVVGPLGSGAMGVVLLAHDETLDRRVAIKFVHQKLLDESFRERFKSEARAMARVNHPNVLHIYAFGEHDGAPYFVMEFVDGVTLERWLARQPGPTELDIALQVLEGICDGVAAIHAADALHRDIKPSNILLDADLRPRVADLGLALLSRTDRGREPELVGTPAYMAPELAFSSELDPKLRERADVYSLGCLAYELFTGRPPFVADSNIGLLLQHAVDPVPPPTTLRPDLPVELNDVLARALEKDPAQRTSSVQAFWREVISGCRGLREPVRILVAEDNDDFREALHIALSTEFAGADIECVPDGRAALDAFERKAPSVAIIDLRMPGLDGLELTGLFRARDPLAAIPIIVLTASGGADEWKQLAAQGADRLLVKPVVLDDVLAIVRRSLNERVSRVSQVVAAAV